MTEQGSPNIDIFSSSEVSDVAQILKTNPSSGLTKQEAESRFHTHGPNQLPVEASKTVLEKIWAQVNSVLIYVLLIGAALSFGFAHYADGFVIIGVIVVNVTLGYFMEDRAENSTKKLKSLLSPTAVVIRDSEKSQIDATHLTVGDVFELQAGDVVPADGRVISEVDLHTLEAPLTGEAHAIRKSKEKLQNPQVPLAERSCMVYSGTQVMKGTATCIATAIGSQCEIGKINSLLKGVEEVKTPLILQLERFGIYLSVAILAVAILALVVALARSYSVAQAFSFAIGIAVAAIPEGLPSCVTITFSIGVFMMSKKNAIVKTLPAVEALGSVSVICSDKTGTLTLNQMTAKVVMTSTERVELSDDGKIINVVPHDKLTSSQSTIDASSLVSFLLPGIFCNDSMIRTKSATPEAATNNSRGIELGDLEAGNESVENSSVKLMVEGDPTEACILKLAGQCLDLRDIKSWLKEIPRIDVIPFDSANKYMATLHSASSAQARSVLTGVLQNVSLQKEIDLSNQDIIFLKGAPEKVLSFCDVSNEEEAAWKAHALTLAALGMRVIGLAYKLAPFEVAKEGEFSSFQHSMKNPQGFRILSLVGITDPPRPDAIEAIASAQTAGIIVKMITGDHPVTAVAIAKQLGLQNNSKSRLIQARLTTNLSSSPLNTTSGQRRSSGQGADEEGKENDPETLRAITGAELDSLLQEEENPLSLSSSFAQTVAKYDVFARTTPEHKLQIVQSLQQQGFICSMTGDGVNDSPALKAASIGVAMGITGTEVAKDAAKIILLDDNFKSIVDAIGLGRCTYQNLTKILSFVLPTNGAQAFSIVTALIIGLDVPITALQILWVNMVTSITLGLVLAFEPMDPSVMTAAPRKATKSIFGKFLSWRIVLITVIFVAIVLGNMEWEKLGRRVEDIKELRTIAVNTLSSCQLGYLLNCRSLRENHPTRIFSGNNVVFIGIAAVIGFQALFTYAPFMHIVFETRNLDAIAWGKIAFWGFVVFILVEIEKAVAPYYHQFIYKDDETNFDTHAKEKIAGRDDDGVYHLVPETQV